MKLNLLIASIMTVTLAACSKDKKVTQYSDILIAATYDDVPKQIFYKNGVSSYRDFKISGRIWVDGKDIYYPVGGGYYKNEILVTLADAKTINSVFVKDGIVYASGIRKSINKAAYWKNGQMTELQPANSRYRVVPSRIIVAGSNNDIYIGGQVIDTASKKQWVTCWKNLVMDTFASGSFLDMAVSGSDVHILSDGSYWKNGIKQELFGPSNKKPEFFTSISVWDNNVYITGGYESALYWRNGLPYGVLPGNGSYAAGVVVDNGRIVVAVNKGPTYAGEYQMEIWKAGIPEVWGQGRLEGIYSIK